MLLFFYAVLSIQMDDQIDGRTLVGGYVCTDRPGEFRWQPGSLTQVQFDMTIAFISNSCRYFDICFVENFARISSLYTVFVITGCAEWFLDCF